MRELLKHLTPAQVADLSEAELAQGLLSALQDRKSSRALSAMPTRTGMGAELFSLTDPNTFDRKFRELIERKIDRSIEWLMSHRLVEPEAGINGANGFIRLSPEGEAMKSLIDFEAIRTRSLLRDEMLHPKLRGKPLKDFRDGELGSAVFEAFKIVEIEVRAAGGFHDTEIGVELMKKAFGEKGPLTDPKANGPARKAIENLFAGAIGKFKNPGSHTHVSFDETLECIEELMIASRLLRHLDKANNPGP